MAVPPGLTDDMNVVLPPGRTVKEIVQFIIQAALRGTPDNTTEQLLVAEFQLSPDVAELVRDRTFGGIVRAATRNEVNRPDRNQDPIAWQSFELATWDPSIIARIYPQLVRPQPTVREIFSVLISLPGLFLWELKKWGAKRKRLHDAKTWLEQTRRTSRSS